MKILIFVAVLLAICGQSAVNVQADVIECNFKDKEFFYPDLNVVNYTCDIKSIQQDENQNVFTGNHQTGKSDSDVIIVEYSSSVLINLTNFDSIFCQKFPKLETIGFRHFKTVNLDKNALYSCKHLEIFQLNNADIKQMPDNFFANSLNLKFLNLSWNRLETLSQNIFQSLTKLNELWLDGNKLTTLNPDWFDNLGNLEILNFGSNEIKELPQNVFIKLENLKQLWLEGNNLVTINADSFGKKLQLKRVHLHYNKITSIDEKFIDDTAVDWLNMKRNSCIDEIISSRDEMKEKLKQCFNNYQPRPAEA